MKRAGVVFAICAFTTAACSDGRAAVGGATEPTTVESMPHEASLPVATPETTPATMADRPFSVSVPSAYDGVTALPLVILLHGFGITGAMQDDFFHFRDLAESRGFLMVAPPSRGCAT